METAFTSIAFLSLLASWCLSRWEVVNLRELIDAYRELDDERVKTIEDLRALFSELGIEPKNPRQNRYDTRSR